MSPWWLGRPFIYVHSSDSTAMWAQVIVSFLAFGAALAVAIIYGKQLQTLREQLTTNQQELAHLRRGQDRDAVLAVTSMLQEDKMRTMRETLYGASVGNKEYEDAADAIGHVLNTIGYLTDYGLVDPALVLNNWEVMIVRCYENAAPWMRAREASEPDIEELWPYFRKLAEQAKARTEPGVPLLGTPQTAA